MALAEPVAVRQLGLEKQVPNDRISIAEPALAGNDDYPLDFAPHAVTDAELVGMLDAVLAPLCRGGCRTAPRRLELALDLVALARGLPLPYPPKRKRPPKGRRFR